MIKAFQEIYGDYLETFDGFLVTHTPVLCRLYEKYKKPILLVNTCRYEQPFGWSGDIQGWMELNACLQRLWSDRLLFPISNNKADHDYLFLGTGIDSFLLPSLCDYTGVQWSSESLSEPAILYSNEEAVPPLQGLLKRSDLPKPFTWAALMNRKAIVHVPYEISTMSIAEQYSAGVPLFFPTKRFLHELWESGKIDFQGPYAREVPIPVSLEEPLNSPDARMWWLDRADYYDSENMKYSNYFDSWEDLEAKLRKFEESPEEIQERLNWIAERREAIHSAWGALMGRMFPSLKLRALAPPKSA
jgi:hypothetical protein